MRFGSQEAVLLHDGGADFSLRLPFLQWVSSHCRESLATEELPQAGSADVIEEDSFPLCGRGIPDDIHEAILGVREATVETYFVPLLPEAACEAQPVALVAPDEEAGHAIPRKAARASCG